MERSAKHNAPILYATPPAKIGKHEWRCVVFTDSFYGNCTTWEFRDLREGWELETFGVDKWRAETEYRTHSYHKSDHGLPKGTTTIYYRHQAAIMAAIGPKTERVFA